MNLKKFKNPCKKCLIQPMCSKICDNYINYFKRMKRNHNFINSIIISLLIGSVSMILISFIIDFKIMFLIMFIGLVLVVGIVDLINTEYYRRILNYDIKKRKEYCRELSYNDFRR